MKKILGNLLSLFAALLLGGCDYNAFFKDQEARIEDGAILQIIAPDKVFYEPGEPLNLTGLTVIAEYPDGNSAMSEGEKLKIHEGYSLSWNGGPLRNGDTGITAQPGIEVITAEWRGRRGDCAIIVGDGNVDLTNPITITNAGQWNIILALISKDSDGTPENPKTYTLNIEGEVNRLELGTEGTKPNITGENKKIILQGSGTLSCNGEASLIRLGAASQTLIINGPVLRERSPVGGLTSGTDFAVVSLGKGTGELQSGAIKGLRTTVTSQDGGTFTMVKGSISGGVSVFNFTMEGGTISGGNGNGSGVWVHKTFTMKGGTISGHIGGGVGVARDAVFTMKGGTISGNTGDKGGGVYVDANYFDTPGGKFIMEGGTISGNTGYWGGGVYVNGTYYDGYYNSANSTPGGTFIMEGGTISDNTAQYDGSYGGGVVVWYKAVFNMTGGAISGNTAQRGGGVYIDYTYTSRGGGTYITGDFTKNGGIIYGGNAESPNTAISINSKGDRNGNAVCLNKGSYYYRNETLGEGDNITSTDDFTENWTKQ